MSDFSDFMTMKIIELRRLVDGKPDNQELMVSLLEQLDAVKNLNVRAPIYKIAEIETLARWTGVSKAELVLEMLSSCMADALKMIEAEGKLNKFNDNLYETLENNYGFIPKRDESGTITGFDIPNQSGTKD